MIKSKKNNPLKKQDDDKNDAAAHRHVPKPTLYSSIIQTEMKLRNISLPRLESKPNTIKV